MFNCPLSSAKANRLIAQLKLASGSSVLDVGCGDGEFLLRIAEQYSIKGLGVDINEELIEAAQVKATQRQLDGSVTFSIQDGSTLVDGRYNLIICIGAEYAFGGYEATLEKLSTILAPDGCLLIGTIFWKQTPAEEYLQLMNGQNDHFSHAETVFLARKRGFLPLYICRSNDDEWDAFESQSSQRRYLEAIELLPSDERKQKLKKATSWQDGYLKWGVNTMGFGFYLLRKVEF